jgi:type II secretory pathway pseudopilin PulG
MNKIKAALFHQSGRSMIEMLGVLAIIGVLSVGGLAGYNMAMRKVRLNQFVSDLQLAVFQVKSILQDKKRGSGNAEIQPFIHNSQEWKNMVASFKAVGGKNIVLGCLSSTSTYCFVVHNLTPDVCRTMIESGVFSSISLAEYYAKPDNDEEQKAQSSSNRANMLGLCNKVEKYTTIDLSVSY